MYVYKNYNQEQLNLQYNNRFHVPGFQDYLDRWDRLSRIAESNHEITRDVPYGDGARECLDIFPSAKPGSATLVFIHGGYWQRFDKSLFYFVASAFAEYDLTTVLLNYPLAPAASIDGIVRSTSIAIDWLHGRILEWNGDPGRLCLVGHSAGAHLAAMVIAGSGRARNFIQSACLISGVFNLVPIQLSDLNTVLQWDAAAVNANSPGRKDPGGLNELVITVGGDETSEFKAQTHELYDQWKNKIRFIEELELRGLNHFSILDSINDRESVLHRSIVKLIK